MTPRVSAASLSTTTRIKAEDLTPLERDALVAQGQIGPDGFLDMEKPAAPEMVDLRADARKKAVASLTSVVGGPAVPQAAPTAAQENSREHAAAIQGYVKELTELQDKLKSRSPCPRCGLGIHETCEIVPSVADTEEFLKCVLSGTGFTKEYYLFGGALTVVLQTRAGDIDDLIRRATTEAMRTKEILSETEVYAMLRQLTVATTLKSYRTKDVTLDFPDIVATAATEFRKSADDRLAKIPAPIQAFLRPLVTDFNVLVDVLTSRAQDPSFWKGTPASP